MPMRGENIFVAFLFFYRNL